jgi:hypothetical protein
MKNTTNLSVHAGQWLEKEWTHILWFFSSIVVTVPDRSRLGHGNVVLYIVIPCWQEEGEWGRVQCGGESWNGQLALSNVTAKMGIHCHVQIAAIPRKETFLSFIKYITIHVCLNILIHNVCVFDLKKKNIFSVHVEYTMCRRIWTCIYSLLNRQ